MNDLLVYGNLDQENLKYLSVKNVFTSKFNLFNSNKYPDYKNTQIEIEKLLQLQSAFSNKIDNSTNLQFIQDADEGLESLFSKHLPAGGIKLAKDYTDKLFTITDDLGALIMQLKNHYQRPRPYQVAYYSKQNLHPFETSSGHSPAFPSGHACQAHFLTLVIALHCPTHSKFLRNFADRVAESRLIMGVHYPSDNAFGKSIAIKLFAMPDIQEYLQNLFK